jgi:hypothetical protein
MPITAKKSFWGYQDSRSDTKPRKTQKNDSWVAPEHGRFAKTMRRDWYRDDHGRPIKEFGRHLVVEKTSAR